VLWFEDLDLTIPINNPSTFSTPFSTTVYAVTFDGQCQSNFIQGVDIILDPPPTVTDISPVTVCGNGQDNYVDLTQYDFDIGGGNTVTWYEDVDGSIPVGDPTFYEFLADQPLYVVVSSGNCASSPTAITFDYVDFPTASADITLDGQVFCQGETVTMNITFANGTPPYYGHVTIENTTQVSFGPVFGSTSVDLTFSQVGQYSYTDTPIYVEDANGCTQLFFPQVEYFYEVISSPTANAAGPLATCDEGGGQATFNLTQLDNTINGGSGEPVNWYEDFSLTIPIFVPEVYTSASTTVYASVGSGGCQSVPVSIDLTVESAPAASAAGPLTACDEGGGQATFDLTQLNATVNGGSGETVTWYADFEALPASEIASPGAYTSAAGFVYARVGETGCQSLPVETELIVGGGISLSCTAQDPESSPGASDGSVLLQFAGGTAPLQLSWSGAASGADNLAGTSDYTLTGLTAGDYSLTVTDNNGCSAQCNVTISSANGCSHPDYDALMALYNATDGPNWTFNGTSADPGSTTAGWDRDCEPCQWYGIECDGNERVTCIDLDGVPACSASSLGGNGLAGEIPAEIGELTFLTSLQLRFNSLVGSIPSTIGDLSNLQVLFLGDNFLTGSIPEELGNLTQLRDLNLQFNLHSGTI
ncbi:MAG: hypothetical protein KDC54_14685, partial [Lewinella sp.]|nr:hypothetical protein [Lewinella sp.]